ncbi:MAG: hypothetical protein COA84_15610 [Robiginitomaculum sp.]|nr:MAG: hypothetical protein COA84_15610 [Robiginitomaculum sp.]
MHAINRLIDRIDAYMRESKASWQYLCQNKTYRKISENGMVGSFLEASQTINSAVDFVDKKNAQFLKMGTFCESQMKQVVDSISSSVGTLNTATKYLKHCF